MRLAILCTMINGFGRKGFYNSQEIGLGKELVRQGHTVTIYKGVDESESSANVKIGDNLVIHYLPIKRMGANGRFPNIYFTDDIDGLFVFADQQVFLPHIFRWWKKREIPVVPYVGTVTTNRKGLKTKISRLLFLMGTNRWYQHMNVLAKSPKVKDDLVNLGVPEHQIQVSYVGLDMSLLHTNYRETSKEELKEKHGFGSEERIILNVARLVDIKRPLDLIDIFARVKDEFRLVIIGKGELEEALRQKIKEMGLENRVTLLSEVPYEEMWEWYRLSDYFLNLCSVEIFGMAILEAIFYECSVAATWAVGPSIILDGMEGHKLANSDEEIVEWLKSKYPSKKTLEESSEKVKKNFTWEQTAKNFVEIVRRES